MVTYVGNIPDYRIPALTIEADIATRADAAQFARELADCGLLPRTGKLRPVLPATGGAPGLAYYVHVSGPNDNGSAGRGYGVKTPSGAQAHAGPPPGGSPKPLRDRLGAELDKSALYGRRPPRNAHT